MTLVDGSPSDFSDVNGMIALMALWLVVIGISELVNKYKRYKREKYLYEHTPWRLDWTTRSKWDEKMRKK